MPNQPHPASAVGRKPSQLYRIRNQAVRVPDGYMAVGHIVGVHALRGEIKLEPYTDFPERFVPGELFWMGEELAKMELASVRSHKNVLLLRFVGIEDRSAAERLRGQWLFIEETEAVSLEEGSYWIHDLLGMQVTDTSGNLLGRVVEVLATGANDVYVVRPADSERQELLLPAIPEVILAVDLATRTMRVQLLDGLAAPESVE
jgi:16S rRNA processing protein RimM